MAEGGSDAPLFETPNREVITTLNNIHTSVLIDTSKEKTVTDAEGSQVQQPHRQTPEVTTVINTNKIDVLNYI